MKFRSASEGQWFEGQGYGKKVIFTGEELNSPANFFQIAKIVAGSRVPVHSHEVTDELFYALRGEIDVIVDGQKFHLKPGDSLLCQAGEKHELINASETDFELLVFKLNFKAGDTLGKT